MAYDSCMIIISSDYHFYKDQQFCYHVQPNVRVFFQFAHTILLFDNKAHEYFHMYVLDLIFFNYFFWLREYLCQFSERQTKENFNEAVYVLSIIYLFKTAK